MFKTFIKMLTPFIISVIDVIDGVLLYLEHYKGITVDARFYSLISHSTGSSILVLLYIIVSSTHMCKYYKTSCWMIVFMHTLTILYIYTNITLLFYLLGVWIFSGISLVCWTISVLGHKTYKTIHQSYKRE